MCYVVPFTLPCCRRTYVSVTKMKDCPSDWPKTKCPKELCFQIGSQPDDRNDGTCWRCKAVEAGIAPEDRESLRPGIDSADVERFIVTPDERRSQMEENGFCWFCGHRCECELCEPVKIDGLDGDLLGRNRPPPVEEKRSVNKRLKVEHPGRRPKSGPSSSKLKPKPKARPQTRSMAKSAAKSASRAPSNSQSPSPPDQLLRREFSPSEDQIQQHALKPEVKYSGYGDQSHIFGLGANGRYPSSQLDQGQINSGYGDQLQIRDPRLLELPFSADQVHYQYGELQLPNPRPVAAMCLAPTKEIYSSDQCTVHDASPSRPHYAYQHSHILDPDLVRSSQGTPSKLSQEPQKYAQPHMLDPRLATSPLGSHLYPQTQYIDPALFNMNQESPSNTAQTYHQQTMHNSSCGPLYEQQLGDFKQEFNAQKTLNDTIQSNTLGGCNGDVNEDHKRRREGEHQCEYPDPTNLSRW